MEFINYVSTTFVSVVLTKHKTRELCAADCKRRLLSMQWYFFFFYIPACTDYLYLVEQLDVTALSEYHHKNVNLPAVITTISKT